MGNSIDIKKSKCHNRHFSNVENEMYVKEGTFSGVLWCGGEVFSVSRLNLAIHQLHKGRDWSADAPSLSRIFHVKLNLEKIF